MGPAVSSPATLPGPLSRWLQSFAYPAQAAFDSLMGTGRSRGECQRRGESFLGLLSSCSGGPGQLGGRRGSPTKLSPKACLPGDASLPPPPGEVWIGGGRRPLDAAALFLGQGGGLCEGVPADPLAMLPGDEFQRFRKLEGDKLPKVVLS